MVYLVDDDTDDLELMQEAFSRSGFQGQLVCANNGEDFLSKLHRSNRPELIVLDLNMPLKDGFEVLAELKKSRNYSLIPVAILTASHNRQDEERCVDLGCNLFLRKPSTFDGYRAIIATLFNFLRDFKGRDSTSIATPEG